MDESIVKNFEKQVTWARICNRAADLIDGGFCKRTQCRADNGEDLGTDVTNARATKFCLAGALHRAAIDAGRSFDGDVWPKWSNSGAPSAHWNNAPERTAAEVAALLREHAGIPL